jgi:PHP family Zn ribbon phosphoesterase
MIAITDHNAIEHAILACTLSKGKSIKVIPGVELTTREEVHLLAYFPDIESLWKMGEKIKNSLPKLENRPSFFGYQLVYNSEGQLKRIDHVLRQNSLNIDLDSLVCIVRQLGGIAIPAHIERERFSLISQLGFLDSQADYDAVEISKHNWIKKGYQLGDFLQGFPVISGSDSHFFEDIGNFFMETKHEEIKDFISLKKYLESKKHEKYC